MKVIEGTATIGLETLDNLRQREQLFSELRRDVKKLIKTIDTEEYEKRQNQIDDMRNVSDEEFNRLEKEAAMSLKIIISDKVLRKLIREYIDESEINYGMYDMTEEEFSKIPLILESEWHTESKRSAGQLAGQDAAQPLLMPAT